MNPNNIWFTADPHFWHKNILKYCPDRGCESVEEMNERIIESWNQIIPPNGHVFLLGDLAFCGLTKKLDILSRLSGRKYLIRGNHDQGLNDRIREHFVWVKDYHELKTIVDDKPKWINLCHYPMYSWNRAFHGSWMLHGHRHGLDERIAGRGHLLDVGVDSALLWLGEMRPFSLEDVTYIMRHSSKAWVEEKNNGN